MRDAQEEADVTKRFSVTIRMSPEKKFLVPRPARAFENEHRNLSLVKSSAQEKKNL